MSTDAGSAEERYLAPTGFDRVFNRVAAWFVRRGASLKGARILEVVGRTSGEPRRTPVNLLVVDGRSYLVAPRGVTHWVRNLRAAGEGTLRSGRTVTPFTARELADDEKSPVIARYLDEWWFEVGRFFDEVGRHPDDAQLAELAPQLPCFEITTAGGRTS